VYFWRVSWIEFVADFLLVFTPAARAGALNPVRPGTESAQVLGFILDGARAYADRAAEHGLTRGEVAAARVVTAEQLSDWRDVRPVLLALGADLAEVELLLGLSPESGAAVLVRDMRDFRSSTRAMAGIEHLTTTATLPDPPGARSEGARGLGFLLTGAVVSPVAFAIAEYWRRTRRRSR